MGETVAFGQGLIVTVFSMAVVLAVLLLISYLINILKVTTNGKDKKVQPEETEALVEKKQKYVEKGALNKNVDDEELTAVIAAAISASMGVSIPDINIKAIRRVSQNTSTWAEMGRKEQISRNL